MRNGSSKGMNNSAKKKLTHIHTYSHTLAYTHIYSHIHLHTYMCIYTLRHSHTFT